MQEIELKNLIYNLISFIEKNHPCFYQFKSRDELNNELNYCIKHKEKYNQYDLYYYFSHIIKFMIGKHDLHTRLTFEENNYLPIKLKYIDNELYIINSINHESIEYGKIISINGTSIEKILKDLEYITCYDKIEHFNVSVENNLIDINILRSLPSLNINDQIEISVLKDEKIINEKLETNNYKKVYGKMDKPNYYYEVINNILCFRYQCCCDIEYMNKMIKILSEIKNINKYIIDVRDNRGGNSDVNVPLLNFLKDKNTVIISNNNVFSSALMFLVDCKINNIPIIGSSPASSINSIGNTSSYKEIENTNLKLIVSTKYFYYDDNYNCYGVSQNNFNVYNEKISDFLKLKYITLKENISLSLNDYKENNDFILNSAYEFFNNKIVK